jgi:hypothetical protein
VEDTFSITPPQPARSFNALTALYEIVSQYCYLHDGVKVSNLDTRDSAAEYAVSFGFEVVAAMIH